MLTSILLLSILSIFRMSLRDLNIAVTPSKEVMSVMRIYVVSLMRSEFGIEGFTRDCVDCIAIYAFRCMAALILQVKGILSSQGRCIPNFLHILASYQLANKSIDSLAEHLNNRLNEISKQDPTRWSIKKLTQRLPLLEDKVDDREYSNIYSIPFTYLMKNCDPLPIRMPVDECVLKPPEYCYMERLPSPEKEVDFEEGIKEGVYIQNQLKWNLEIRRRPLSLEWNGNIPEVRNQKQPSKMLFGLCKYL